MGILDIILSGGEPLLHPHFCDFLKKAKEYDFSVTVLSNLTMLDETILLAMKDGILSSVGVSLYSMKSEIHDSITKLSGSFEKTKAGILKLIDNNIPVQINCPLMKQNKDSYKDVLLWGHDKKCRVLTDFMIMAKYDHTTDNLLYRLSMEEAGEVMVNIAENDIVYQQRLTVSDFESSYAGNKDISNDIICGVCITFLGMVSNGNVYPCPGWQDYVCGNIGETNLKDIWEKSPQIQYLRSLRRKDFPQCLNCEDRGFCALCMGRNANEDPNGNFFNINKHFCEVAAINRKIALEWREKHLQND
jgi:radical SAM protein with 4Fe4S-binding SPASM domain